MNRLRIFNNRFANKWKKSSTRQMKALIQSVAQDQTKSGLTDVIAQAVDSQVQNAIQAEHPKIQQTVIQETKKTVSQLTPTIDRAVKEKAEEAEGRVFRSNCTWEEVYKREPYQFWPETALEKITIVFWL